MRQTSKYPIQDLLFKEKLLQWSRQFEVHCFLNSSEVQHLPDQHDFFSGVDVLNEIQPIEGAFESLKLFYETHKDWLFGFLAYELKNQLENLVSAHTDKIQFPVMHFFRPRYVFELVAGILSIHHFESQTRIDQLFFEIMAVEIKNPLAALTMQKMHAKVDVTTYMANVKTIQANIQKGMLYELNYCQEFYIKDTRLDPYSTYWQLNKFAPTPFSCFYKLHHKYLISASPERFLKKTGDRLLSQPIKGTVRRGSTPNEDLQLKAWLGNSEKEKAENTMIVDLVRNDLAQTAQVGSVVVEELCGIYTFPQVHQMISSISSILRTDIHFVDAIKAAFPMGSMTGAPKIKAMEQIEAIEASKRGLYSGALGYISPIGDFDFNVVIRSIQYNESERYLNFMVGSAITAASEGKLEYEECLVKAIPMLKAINACI